MLQRLFMPDLLRIPGSFMKNYHLSIVYIYFNMLFTFYIQNISILLTVNILYSKYHQNAYYPQM